MSFEDTTRPWPRPARPWFMTQMWHHVLFLHWPIDPAAVRSFVPPSLEIETRNGSAWITLIGFEARGVRPRGLPAMPGLSRFPQLNLRTYVKHGDRPGVFFLRVEVGSRLSAILARGLLRLPFRRARVELRYEGWEWALACRSKDVSFAARYVSQGAEFLPAPGSLEHWLAERFCFYAAGRSGRITRGEIDHPPWELVPAKARISETRWPDRLGTALAEAPALAHYCGRQRAYVWWPRRVTKAPPAL